MSFYSAKLAKAMGKAKVIEEAGVTDSELLSILQGYRRSVASAYIPVLPEDIGDHIPKGELCVSRKFDGELWFLIQEGKDLALSNSRGKVIFGNFPVLKEAKASLNKSSGRIIIAGELYVENEKQRTRAGDLNSSMGGGTKAKIDSIKFIAFDVLYAGDETFAIDQYLEKLTYLDSLFKGNKTLTTIDTKVVTTSKEVSSHYQQWVVEEKHEGIVVRAAGGRIYKLKPSFSIDAAVIGYTERYEDSTQVSAIALALMHDNETYQFIGSCGNLGSDKNRKVLMKLLEKNQVDSTWRLSSRSGVMHRFVKPTLVVEMKATDIQSEDSIGEPIKKMSLCFDDSGWSAVGKSYTASVLHPVLVRIREDKEVCQNDIRASQLSDLCFLHKGTTTETPAILPESEILKREVYTKNIKGSMAVKKLVLWQTNKQKADPDYPAFVLHWTDYSPGRRNPLTRQVRLAPDKKIAQDLFESILSENIKTGWEKK
jgi:hypothetical protein